MRKLDVVLVGGATGREHAMARHFVPMPGSKSDSAEQEYNLHSIMWADHPFVRQLSTTYNVMDIRKTKQLVDLIRQIEPDWVVIGQGETIQDGLKDSLDKIGIPCIAPTKEMAKLEGSKSYTRQVAASLDETLNPVNRIFAPNQRFDALEYVTLQNVRFVVKCNDVVTGGNRVKIFSPEECGTALQYTGDWLAKGHCIVVEEFIEGHEVAMMSIADGKIMLHSPPFRNYKRIYDGDMGDNTSGMGSVMSLTELPFMTEKVYSRMKQISEMFFEWTKSKFGEEYKGSLYGEFIVTSDGNVKLIEFNNRFGNPSSMNMLTMLKPGFANLCQSILDSSLSSLGSDLWHTGCSISAYAVPEGYPYDSKNNGTMIDIGSLDAETFYCGRMDFGKDIASQDLNRPRLMPSRAFAVCTRAANIDAARQYVYSELAKVGPAIHYRKDIGVKL